MATKKKSRDSESSKTKKSVARSSRRVVPVDTIALIIDHLLSLDTEVQVKVHDERWVEVSFPGAPSVEQILQGLRQRTSRRKAALTSQEKQTKERTKARKKASESLVKKLDPSTKIAACFCMVEDERLYVDAIPMSLKTYLIEFIREFCGVEASKATMEEGICAEIRSSPDYIPNT